MKGLEMQSQRSRQRSAQSNGAGKIEDVMHEWVAERKRERARTREGKERKIENEREWVMGDEREWGMGNGEWGISERREKERIVGVSRRKQQRWKLDIDS
jgi:hypothetical protein